MDQHTLILFLLFISFFLFTTSLLQTFSKRYPIPYTVALLVAGMVSQLFGKFMHLETTHFSLSPDIIYYLLLPLLLFESSYHIHIHQFRLQFKTITFFATFGLLVSLFVIGYGMAFFLGLPLGVSLLFGALISATDPIAVIALFKTLGAPKRLGLVADGESMFNDATAVIAFRVVAGFVLTGTAFEAGKIVQSLGNFVYLFIGSIFFGVVLGYLASKLIQRIHEDRAVETTITLVLALFSFVGAEHFFQLSGVISTVLAGITLGYFGKTKISPGVKDFVNEWWEYIAFLCVSLVFFFAAFNLDVEIFFREPLRLLIIIALVLIARAVSVYLSAFITNKSPLFKDEPDIPLAWQHILNWGGLRGVIPLVLVYSLPEDFAYKQEILGFTLSTLVFTLIVNGLSIQWLLTKLGLHLPKKEEEIINDELHIFEVEEQREKLDALPRREFDANILRKIERELQEQEEKYKEHLLELSKSVAFVHSLKLQSLAIERETLHKLYEQGRFSETVYYEFESELDIQQDALEHPDLRVRNVTKSGFIDTSASFRKRIIRWRRFLSKFPLLGEILHITEQDYTRERYSLMRARLFTSYAVLDYLSAVEKIFRERNLQKAVRQVRDIQEHYIEKNKEEMQYIAKHYPELTTQYQEAMIRSLIKTHHPASSH